MTKHSDTGRHRMAARAIFAAVAAGGVLAVAASGASAASSAAQPQTSQNWSGYVAQSSAGQRFSSVSGSWVQPSVNANDGSSSGASAFWVGLGGSSQDSQSLEQVGTAADVRNGQTDYYAWYELVPSPQTRLDLPIHPGDHMSAKVSVSGDSVSVWLSDDTTGQSVTKDLQMSSPDTSSAEWIAEAPAAQMSSGDYQVLPLADFGSVTFTGASATAGGHTGSIADPSWSVQQVDMSAGASRRFLDAGAYDPGGATAVAEGSAGGASAGDVSSDGSSFTVTYGSGQTVQPASVSPSGGYDPGSSGAYGDPGYGYGGSSGYGDPGYGYGYGDPYGYSGYGE